MMDFEQVFRLRQSELKKALTLELQEMGFNPIVKKSFLYAPGEVPVMLIAHLDTVHITPVDIICYSKDGRYVMSPQGIGGDDRAGVWMILQILRRVNCHVLFCEDEESGGIGARAFIRSGLKVRVNYMVELDRKGENDAVFYGCDNPEFKQYIEEFGFREALGSFSDISIVAPNLKTAAVNISTGYYNAHRPHEYIDTVVMAENVERVTEMIMTPTGHFKYGGVKLRSWGMSLFDREITDMTGDDTEHKFLMRLPEDTLLQSNGGEHTTETPYMVDRHGGIYAYIEALDAAVESDIFFACSRNGTEVEFRSSEAEMVKVMTYEDAMCKLMDSQVAFQ